MNKITRVETLCTPIWRAILHPSAGHV